MKALFYFKEEDRRLIWDFCGKFESAFEISIKAAFQNPINFTPKQIQILMDQFQRRQKDIEKIMEKVAKSLKTKEVESE